jgi:hypothetical protein
MLKWFKRKKSKFEEAIEILDTGIEYLGYTIKIGQEADFNNQVGIEVTRMGKVVASAVSMTLEDALIQAADQIVDNAAKKIGLDQ